MLCLLSLGKAMQRREFFTLLGGAAVSGPLAARAQQSERMRRIGMLTGIASDDTACTGAFVQELHERGWMEGIRF
jgi:putative tryptophan/tyrosine transport system substrate-binding protein